jgi:hypothetical protein
MPRMHRGRSSSPTRPSVREKARATISVTCELCARTTQGNVRNSRYVRAGRAWTNSGPSRHGLRGSSDVSDRKRPPPWSSGRPERRGLADQSWHPVEDALGWVTMGRAGSVAHSIGDGKGEDKFDADRLQLLIAVGVLPPGAFLQRGHQRLHHGRDQSAQFPPQKTRPGTAVGHGRLQRRRVRETPCRPRGFVLDPEVLS